MPQATEKLRARITTMFGSLDDAGPCQYLERHGYTLATTQSVWFKPGVTELWEMTNEELICLEFLVEEWDYGGLIPATDTNNNTGHLLQEDEEAATAVTGVDVDPLTPQ